MIWTAMSCEKLLNYFLLHTHLFGIGVCNTILPMQINMGIANLIFIRKKWRSVRIFFATWNERFTRLSFCERPEYNREKNWACCTSFCSSWNETSNNCFREEHQKKLKLDYENRLQKFKICDPLSIEPSKRIDDILQWPHIDTGVIFTYKLKRWRTVT